MAKRLLDYDPDTGVSEYFHYDAHTDTTVVETVQDVEPILNRNKDLTNDEDYTKVGMKKEMWHYASIPLVVQMRWLNEYGMENWPMHPHNKDLLFRLLNSPEWRYLKTTGKIHVAKG